MKRKKLLSMLLAGAMLMSALSGCGNAEGTATSTTQKESDVVGTTVSSDETAQKVEEEIPNFHAEGYPIVDEEVTLKIMFLGSNSNMYVDADEMPVIQQIEELTGVDLEIEIITNDWGTNFNLMLASGEYPDIIMANGQVDYEEYGVSQKVLLPLDDLIEKYMPNYTGNLATAANDPIAHLVASDGQQYSIARVNLNGTYNMGSYPFINMDWLKALNLEVPKNIEGLTEVLRAFKTGDPNGNGQADEIPYMETLESLTESVQMFGVPSKNLYEDWVYIDENKELQLAAAAEGTREWLEWMHLLYEEELVDVEMFTMTTQACKAKMDTGNAGFMMTARKWSLGIDGIAESIEIWTPEEEDFLFARKYSAGTSHTHITTQCEYPEVAARVIDAFLEKETALSMYYGEQNALEGKSGWKYVEDGRVQNYSVKSESNLVDYFGSLTLVCWPGELYQEIFVPSATVQEGYDYRDAMLAIDGWQTYSNQLLNYVQLTETDKERANLIKTNILTTVKEYVYEFVKNGVTDDSWNEFVKKLEDIGAAEAIEIYQKALDNSNF